MTDPLPTNVPSASVNVNVAMQFTVFRAFLPDCPLLLPGSVNVSEVPSGCVTVPVNGPNDSRISTAVLFVSWPGVNWPLPLPWSL